MKGAASENSQWSREVRQTDLNGEEIGESLEEICAEKNTGVSLRRFEAYLVARRAMAYYRRNPEESADTCRAKFGNDYATLSKVEGAATDKMRVCGPQARQVPEKFPQTAFGRRGYRHADV